MTQTPHLNQANILIVDDTTANLHLLSNILQEAGYLVRATRSGARAITAIKAKIPDLILLDVLMPEMDGYETCAQLKANEFWRNIPIIFISALDQTEDKVKSFAVGGVDYITKPFQAEEVLARVQTHLKIHQLQAALLDKIAELDAFAHTVAHDLKTPLSAIMGYSQLLEQNYSFQPSDGSHFLEKVVNNTNYMNNIINSLLVLASVRKQDIVVSPIDMNAIVKQANNRLGHMIEDQGATIRLPEEWPLVQGYAPWVEEVWVNYISNGMKYGGTPPQLEIGSTSLDNTRVRYWVRDNGAGISPEKQDTLFTEFTRLDALKSEGHGLGLSIVRRIMDKLDGNYGVKSEVGKGSQFYFDLPTI